MVPRGERDSGYDLGAGAFAALAVEVTALWLAGREALQPRSRF